MTRKAWTKLGGIAAAAALAALGSALALPALAQQTAALGSAEATGRALFNQSCMVCHEKPQITSGMYGPVLSRDTAGGDAAVMRGLIRDGTPRMPAFKYQFTPQQIDAIVAYIKTRAPATAAAGGNDKGGMD